MTRKEAAIRTHRFGSPIAGSPSSKNRILASEQWVPAGIGKTFAFFSNPANLQALTPPYLDFQIRTPLPITMRPGALIEYRLRLMGVPMGWLSRIDDWRPGAGFTDVQVRGPYARWVHRHRFLPLDGGTVIRDEVEYALPFAPWSEPVHALFVRPRLMQIFGFRRAVIERVLGEP
jgi:ligand-binding SRPBCC domain-containing protein